jgi:CRP-like cAMP-binding protein
MAFKRGCSPDMAGLGKKFESGEVIVRQGDTGNCMFVIQEGEVEAVAEAGGTELRLRTLGPDEFFGEMALFEKEMRTCTIRALKPTRVLTIDKKNFLGGIHEDPSLAFRIVKTMSHRIRDLTDRLAKYEEQVSARTAQ